MFGSQYLADEASAKERESPERSFNRKTYTDVFKAVINRAVKHCTISVRRGIKPPCPPKDTVLVSMTLFIPSPIKGTVHTYSVYILYCFLTGSISLSVYIWQRRFMILKGFPKRYREDLRETKTLQNAFLELSKFVLTLNIYDIYIPQFSNTLLWNDISCEKCSTNVSLQACTFKVGMKWKFTLNL